MPNLNTISLSRYVSIFVPRDPRSDVPDLVLTRIDDDSEPSTYFRKGFTVLCQSFVILQEESSIIESAKC